MHTQPSIKVAPDAAAIIFLFRPCSLSGNRWRNYIFVIVNICLIILYAPRQAYKPAKFNFHDFRNRPHILSFLHAHIIL